MSDKQVRAQYTREYKLEAVRQVRGDQSIAATAKVLGIPRARQSDEALLANTLQTHWDGVVAGMLQARTNVEAMSGVL